jgi:hypothetical protein
MFAALHGAVISTTAMVSSGFGPALQSRDLRDGWVPIAYRPHSRAGLGLLEPSGELRPGSDVQLGEDAVQMGADGAGVEPFPYFPVGQALGGEPAICSSWADRSQAHGHRRGRA